MNKFIRGIVGFSLKNRFFIFFMTGLLIIAGIVSYQQTPLEAFPDVTNTQIIIVTQWNGRSAEEIERFVTVPIEVAMNSVQQKTNVRSTTMFGLSIIKIIFDRSKNWVMVFHSRSKIETRPVDVYRSLANRTYIKTGLKDGETIISKNQLLVYDALND